MKLKSFAIAALAVVTFASCSKKGEINGPGTGSGDPAGLTINVKSPATRATGSPANDAVKNFTAFITNSTGEIEWSAYSNDGSAVNVNVTTDASHVFIVANAGDLSSIATKAQLDSYKVDMTLSTGNQFSLRWATGNTTSPLMFTANSSGDKQANATIDLTFIAARVTVKLINQMTGQYAPQADTKSLVLQNVAVLNAHKHSYLFGQSLVASDSYLSGYTTGNFAVWPADVSQSSDLIDDITFNDFATTYYYYVFENDAYSASEYPTIVTLIGTYGEDEQGNPKNIYYPVHLTSAEGWTTEGVERGKSYDITMTLKFDPEYDDNNDAGGTTDPTIPTENSSVLIDVQLNDWVPLVLNKDFE